MKECTFKPEISEQSRKLIQKDQQPDKCAELFERAKQASLTRQSVRDKTTEEIEYEREKQQCTFRPSIMAAPLSIPRPKMAEKTQQHYERLERAREEKMRVKEITERGYSKPRDSSAKAGSRHGSSSRTRASDQEKPWKTLLKP